MKRALIVCPGRGSYGSAQLGTLTRLAARERQGCAPQRGLLWTEPTPAEPPAEPPAKADQNAQPAPLVGDQPSWRASLATADAWCAAHDLPTISALDAAPRFRPSQHLRSDLASLLISSLSVLDFQAQRAAELQRWRPVAVIGNSLGWYTALAVAGAIEFGHMLDIVGATGGYQQRHGVVGGQLIYPLVDDTWAQRLDPAVAAGARAAANAVGFAAPSIDLGGLMVFAGDDAGLAALEAALPPRQRGARSYPMRLAGHSAFHSPLLAPMAAAVQAELGHVRFRAPDLPLIDGRGDSWRPIHADPAALRAYTLGGQITTPYDFAASLRVAMREYAPEVIVLLGPGASLGGAIGQTLVQLGWRGMAEKADFAALQRGGGGD